MAGQAEPNLPMLLYHLEELANKAVESNSTDASTFVQLAREAEKHRDFIDVPMLALKVLGGRTNDIVGAAVAKQLKAAKKGEHAREKYARGQADQYVSPLQAPGMYQPRAPYPYHQQQQPQQDPWMGNGQGAYLAPQNQARPQRPHKDFSQIECHFCAQKGHLYKDCPAFREAKAKLIPQK